MTPDWRPEITVRRLGREGEALVVVDDFHPDPEGLRGLAAKAAFAPAGVNYPGLRAPAPPEHLTACRDVLGEALGAAFGFTIPALIATDFSLVTTPPDQLAPIQRLPHFDGTHPRVIALLHYLSGPEQGGTSFYRHRATGFETVTTERAAEYRMAIERECVARPPPAGYFSDSDALFERIEPVEAKFNRAILYRGLTLHSGEIPDPAALSSDPSRGRLTVNTFLGPQRRYGGWGRGRGGR